MSLIYDPKYKVFLRCLKDARIRSKLTQQELAVALGWVEELKQGSVLLEGVPGQRRSSLEGVRVVGTVFFL